MTPIYVVFESDYEDNELVIVTLDFRAAWAVYQRGPQHYPAISIERWEDGELVRSAWHYQHGHKFGWTQ